MALHGIFILASLTVTQPPVEDLRFLQPLANLGELRSHVAYKHTFEFVNQGRDPVEIIGVRPSCGCMAVKMPRKIVQPGEKGVVEVEVKPATQTNGLHSWFAKVVYRSGGRQQTAHLQLQAMVRHEVSVVPSVLLWTGNGTQEITLTDIRTPPLAVTAVHFSSTLATAQIASSEKGVSRIVLQATSLIPSGRHDEILTIYTSDGLYTHFQVPVTLIGRERPTIAVTPSQITHRMVAGQPIPPSHVRIRPIGDRNLAIKAVIPDDPAITCTWSGSNIGATLKIEVNAAKLGDRTLNSAVRVQLREPTEQVVVIPVQVAR